MKVKEWELGGGKKLQFVSSLSHFTFAVQKLLQTNNAEDRLIREEEPLFFISWPFLSGPREYPDFSFNIGGKEQTHTPQKCHP